MNDSVADAAPAVAAAPPLSSLAAARAAAGLSVADIGRQLKLSAWQVEALEAGDYARLPGPVFVRGFLRNYARLLKIDPAPLLAELAAKVPVAAPAAPEPVPSANIPFPGESSFRWKPFAIGGLIILAALAGYELIGDDEGATTNSDTHTVELPQPKVVEEVKAPEPEPTVVVTLPAPASGPSPVAAAPAPAPATPPTASPPVVAQQVPAPPVKAAVEVKPAPPAKPAVDVPPAPAAKAPAAETRPVAASKPQVEVTPAPAAKAPVEARPAAATKPPVEVTPAPAAKAPEPRPAPAAEERVVRLMFVRESWVEVRDRQGRIIFSQLNPAGSSQSISGQPPFKLVVGNAGGVRMLYKDQTVDLAPHTQVDVARLTLE